MPADPKLVPVTNNEASSQFEIDVDGQLAYLAYHRFPNGILLQHTEVPSAFEGHGIGGRLAKAALEFARANRLSVIARCPFVAGYVQRHPEYAPLLAKSSAL
jgi:uncharacterized protein